MTLEEYLFSCLEEELIELAQAALTCAHTVKKAGRFGLMSVKQGQSLTNRERIAEELGDILGVIEVMCMSDILPDKAFIQRASDAKEVKLKEYMELSKSLGRLK